MKSAHLRRRSLLQLLQSGKTITQKGAAQEFGVSDRTIRRDIDYLRDCEKQPIKSDHTGFHLRPPSPAEAKPTDDRYFGMLFLAGGFINSRYANLDSTISRQWQKCLLGKPEIYPSDLARAQAAIQLEHPSTTEENLQSIGVVGRSILSGNALAFSYQNLGSSDFSDRLVFPLQLRESHNAWYLIAMCYHSQERRIYALTRIKQLTPRMAPQPIPTETQIQEWLEDDGLSIWLPQPSDPIQTVKIRLTDYAKKHVCAHPIHPSQSITEESEDSCLLTLQIRDHVGIKLWARRFAPFTEILEPQSLRDEMIDDLTIALGNYQ